MTSPNKIPEGVLPLILNCIDLEKNILEFDQSMKRILDPVTCRFQIRHIREWPFSLETFTHLIISGSELSASQTNTWDDKLYEVIHSFMEDEKPVLGICYGHQMLAKAILGETACRRAIRPEFGWMRFPQKENPLFSGLDDPVFYTSHLDEVTHLPDSFEILAWSKDCSVQAFQVRERNMWGVQFHPEMSHADGSKSLTAYFIEHPEMKEYLHSESSTTERICQNETIFHNFLMSQR